MAIAPVTPAGATALVLFLWKSAPPGVFRCIQHHAAFLKKRFRIGDRWTSLGHAWPVARTRLPACIVVALIVLCAGGGCSSGRHATGGPRPSAASAQGGSTLTAKDLGS